MKNAVYLNGVKIKLPHEIKRSRYMVTKANRLANATMKMDLIAKKEKFFFTWKAIDEKDLNKILDIIWYSNNVGIDVKIFEKGNWKTYKCYCGEIPCTTHNFNDGNPIYKDVEINFIEM